MRRTGHHRRGFTLIELMLVVGIIGMLCAMAIPNVQAYGWRAKRTERAITMRNIGQSMTDYILAHEGLTSSGVTQGFLASWNPPLPVTGARRAFQTQAPGWSDLIWKPEGYLTYSYYVVGSFSATSSYFMVMAVGDADGNQKLSQKLDRYDQLLGVWQLTSETESGDRW